MVTRTPKEKLCAESCLERIHDLSSRDAGGSVHLSTKGVLT